MPTPPKAPTQSPAKARSAQRFAALNSFVDDGIRESGISLQAAALWLALFRHARDQRVAVPITILVDSLGVSKPTIQRLLRELVAKRMMRVVKKGGLGHGVSLRALASRPRPPKGGTTP